MNLGEQEYLVGASPEMFVRVEEVHNEDLGRKAMRVETCPISGTVARGADAQSFLCLLVENRSLASGALNPGTFGNVSFFSSSHNGLRLRHRRIRYCSGF